MSNDVLATIVSAEPSPPLPGDSGVCGVGFALFLNNVK
jgi:hypothetical protein